MGYLLHCPTAHIILNSPMNLQCFTNVWSPRIGDPNLLAWIITFCYFLAVILTYAALKRVGNNYSDVTKARVFWLGLLMLMVFLGLNKQLDLQSFLTAALKCQALLEGWYEQRREIQLIFVITMAVGFAAFLAFVVRYFRENLRKDWLAVIGIVFILGFILIHLSYFNSIDMPAVNSFYEAGLNGPLELAGIFFICLQSLIRLKSARD